MTVAVLDEETKSNFKLDRSLVDRQYTRGSGNGGQNRNKVETCVVLTYKPTGLQVRVEEHRTRQQNEEVAWRRMEERLAETQHAKEKSEYDSIRTGQIGLGMRGSKVRTYRVQDNQVLDHLTNKKTRLDELYKGSLDRLK